MSSTSRRSRSLHLTEQGRILVRKAMIQRKLSTQVLVYSNEVSESTVKKFLAGKPVGHIIFAQLCESLGLEWSDVAYLDGSFQITETPIDVALNQCTEESTTHNRLTDLETNHLSFILTGTFNANQSHKVEQFGMHLERLLINAHIAIDQKRYTAMVEGNFTKETKVLAQTALSQFQNHLTSSHITYFSEEQRE